MKRSIASYFIYTKKEELTEATNIPAPSANSDPTDDVTTTTGTSDTELIKVPELNPGSSSYSFATGKISTPSTGNEVCNEGVSKPMSSSVTVVNDISEFVGVTAKLTNSQKVDKYYSLWKPWSNFEFPTQDGKSFKRHFQRKWLDEYKRLAYSKVNSGLYCASCVFFLAQNEVGMGCHQNAVTFVTKSFYNLKKAVESLKQHQSTIYHINTVLAQADVAVVEKRKESIDMLLYHSRKKDAENNREQLHGIVETIRLCDLGHADCGCISVSIPVDNDGNFRSLLRYRANGGDQELQDHI
ncbi:hypothetical protein PR048_014975 [Dryococelus australis]|uniref:TTF-type domain-containing protein n=1 Tax=Dryococelus australis TaxID=614101 RepID=A0ABQ9HFW2_9NEOP|nr:hypothetical protein PR048_014975 [Dryococelus australis]